MSIVNATRPKSHTHILQDNPTIAIIWDLDKTLYPYNKKFFAASQQALYRVILTHCPTLSSQEAFNYAAANYPMQTIKRLHQDYKLDPKMLFYSYFNELDESFLEADSAMLKIADQLTPHVRFGLLTHGNKNWSNRALHQLGWDPYIPTHYRQTIDSMKHDKDQESGALSDLLLMMDTPPERAIIVDDKDRNLRPAAALGCLTVLITNQNPDPEMTVQHAHYIYDFASDFLQDFKESGFHLQKARLVL